jgi:hypothetical protein
LKEGFVDGERFHDRRGVLEHAEDGFARLAVLRHAWLDDHSVWTKASCGTASHRGSDAEGLGLIARGEHDPSSDDDRPATEPRVVALLDRRIEGVEVGVEDRGFVHERMFPQEDDGGRRAAPRLNVSTDEFFSPTRSVLETDRRAAWERLGLSVSVRPRWLVR